MPEQSRQQSRVHVVAGHVANYAAMVDELATICDDNADWADAWCSQAVRCMDALLRSDISELNSCEV